MFALTHHVQSKASMSMQKNMSSLFKILWLCKGVYKYRGTLSARAPAWGGLIYEMIAYDDVEKNENFLY